MVERKWFKYAYSMEAWGHASTLAPAQKDCMANCFAW